MFSVSGAEGSVTSSLQGHLNWFVHEKVTIAGTLYWVLSTGEPPKMALFQCFIYWKIIIEGPVFALCPLEGHSTRHLVLLYPLERRAVSDLVQGVDSKSGLGH